MRLLVTGAGGFVGRAVAREVAQGSAPTRVRLLDRVAPPLPSDPRFETMAADLTDPGAIAAAIADVDVVLHLASVPGGAAEADPTLSRVVNLDASLALLEAMERAQSDMRLVYASSIAVLGAPPGAVDDDTPAAPLLTYGAHKRMVEIALGDFQRRGHVSGVALRLPGVVARPTGDGGLRSAFMSDLIHAGAADAAIDLPVSPNATLWLASARQTARNLVHAALLDRLDGRAVTVPALRVTVEALAAACYPGAPRASFVPDPAIERAFGSMPPLRTPAADALGFRADASLADLVAAARDAA